jgi:hypothetical protein
MIVTHSREPQIAQTHQSTYAPSKREHRTPHTCPLSGLLLCKILCHNICCLIQAMEQFGIPVDFSANPVW